MGSQVNWGRAAAVLVSLLVAAVSHADTYTVTTLNASGTGSLGQAIVNASINPGPDLIRFAVPGGAGTITLTSGGLGITDAVTIDGASQPGMTVSGSVPGQPVFTNSPGVTADIIGLTISGGIASSGGGVANFGVLTLTECTLSGNTAILGGGIYNEGTLTMTSSTVSGNSATSGDGGGIYNEGTLTMTNSTVSGNSAPSGEGGGIWNGGAVAVTNGIISGNTSEFGGGISNNRGRGLVGVVTMTLQGSTISSNTAGWGGGIDNFDSSTLTVIDSTISNNTADYGGGIRNLSNSTLTLVNGTISGNSAAVFGGGIGSYDNCSVGISTSTISGNSAIAGGGIDADTSTSFLSNSIVANNTGGDCFTLGGAFFDQGRNIVEDGSCINLAISSSGDPGLGPLAGNGGPTLTHALLPGSIAIDAGDCAGGVVTTDQRGFGRPSGAACDIGAFEVQFPYVVINLNDAGAGSLRQAVANANAKPGPDEILFAVPGGPGTITLTGGALTIADTLLVDGLSQPGMTVSGAVPGQRVFDIASGNVAEIAGLTISGGNADFGGGLYNRIGSVLTVRECAFTGNSGINGGGIANGGTLTLNDSMSLGNSANFGGGLYNFGTIFVARNTISGNVAGVNGGGIYNSGNALVTESTLSTNSAPNGGGGGVYSNNSIGMINSTLSGNVAVFGGGIYSDGATSVFSSTLSGNTAFLAGGGIYSNIGLLSLSNTIVAGSLGGDCVDGGTTLADLGYNIVQDGSCITEPTSRSGNPLLGPLGDNGGATQTHPLLGGSIAIDAGDCAGGSVVTDQRGEPRPSGVACDIGAFEADVSTTTYTVTTLNDSGPGSLRQAILDANIETGSGEIVFAVPGGAGTIALTSGVLTISDALRIDALTQPGMVVSGSDSSQVFTLPVPSIVEIVGLTIRNGSSFSLGGGISTLAGSTLTLRECTIRDNYGLNGGGIANSGSLTLVNSTVSGNSADDKGGGIVNFGTLTLINSTLAANSDTAFGGLSGGIYSTGTMSMSNTIIADNVGADCVIAGGTFTDLGSNIIEDGSCITDPTSMSGDPGLAPLADNGGPTPTHALPFGSIAIDAGDCDGGSITTDQRGEARPFGGGCDIGSFESQVTCPVDLNGDGLLDLADIVAFVTAFSSNDPLADLAEPYGLFDLADIVAFVTAFSAGCP